MGKGFGASVLASVVRGGFHGAAYGVDQAAYRVQTKAGGRPQVSRSSRCFFQHLRGWTRSSGRSATSALSVRRRWTCSRCLRVAESSGMRLGCMNAFCPGSCSCMPGPPIQVNP